ncbi:MAG: hypothetical protein ACYC9L_06700 [Sulfuricaulis sp.]
MADWYGSSRSNYFHVKDADVFRKAMANFDVEVWDNKEDPALFGLGCGECSDGMWPSWDCDTDEEFDFIDKVWPHLADGEVAVFQTIGSERMRYLTGFATAVNHTGERVDVSIEDIYEKAEQAFQTKVKTKSTY